MIHYLGGPNEEGPGDVSRLLLVVDTELLVTAHIHSHHLLTDLRHEGGK